jgi:hypothetical protein
MRCSRLVTLTLVTTALLLLAVGTARAQWESAALEPVATDADYEGLGRRNLALDEAGTLHLLYVRGLTEAGLYYCRKSVDGSWSDPELVNPGSAGSHWLHVDPATGIPYALMFRDGQLTLATRLESGWSYQTLPVPPELQVHKGALTVDARGVAHLALVVKTDSPLIWQMAYGYWDGSGTFPVHLFERSWLPEFGLFAAPDIVVRPDGSVTIAYQNQTLQGIEVGVYENSALGSADWVYQRVFVPGYFAFPQSLLLSPKGELHLAFHANFGLGTINRVYYSRRGKNPNARWTEPVLVSGEVFGARPRLALTPRGEAHIVFERTQAEWSAGVLVHAYRDKKVWRQDVLVENEAFDPAFVLDAEGNGSLVYRRGRYPEGDLEYYGYVEPPAD